jgi:hypothetical protein
MIDATLAAERDCRVVVVRAGLAPDAAPAGAAVQATIVDVTTMETTSAGITLRATCEPNTDMRSPLSCRGDRGHA